MKTKLALNILTLFFVFTSCNSSKDTSTVKDKNIVKINILQLNDVYEMSAVSGGKLGGLDRVQTLLKQLKSENKNTFSVLSGDMLSPSAIGTAYYGDTQEKLAGRQMVDILNHMEWDYFMLGNHEFDLKEKDLRARLKEMKFKVISDNVLDAKGQLFPNTQTCTQFEVEGVKIGILAITIDKFQPEYLQVSKPLEAAKKAVAHLQELDSDIIIALTHLTLQEDIELAVEIPEIDMIMGGHEHENFKLLRGNNYTPITKADANAKTAFVHQLTYNKETKALDIDADLVFIDDHLASDPVISTLIDEWTEIAFNSFEKKGYKPKDSICISTKVLDGTEASVRSRATDLTDLITKGFFNAYEAADASLLNGGAIRIDDKLQPGPITGYDIIKISPFGGTISLVKMKGNILIEALEDGLTKQGSGGFLQYYNISKQNNQWLINHKPIQKKKEYKIALTTYQVEKSDNEILNYKYHKVDSIPNSPKHDFFEVIINQFKDDFPNK